MLKYSVNNQTFYRSKIESHKWLGRRFLNRTFSMQEDDPVVDVEEIRELLDEDIEEGDSE
jgi:hypothetical protein